MASLLLYAFILCFFFTLGMAVLRPALAVPLGIMTYPYKQIVAIGVPSMHNMGPQFNYLMAGVIALVYLYNLIMKHPGVTTRTREAKYAQFFIWSYAAYFWISLLWSPFYGTEIMKVLPYFLIYFGLLPSLVSKPGEMIGAFRWVWALTLLGTLALLASPAFFMSTDVGRMVVHIPGGRVEESSPLAIADMGAYLLILSAFEWMHQQFVPAGNRNVRSILKGLSVLGMALGTWLTFNTSRGELITGVFTACLLIGLVRGRNLRQYLSKGLGLLAGLVVVGAVLFMVVRPFMGKPDLSFRYSPEAIVEGSDSRMDLGARTIEFGLSSERNLVFGIGARGCERRLGMYPHNIFIQAFGETGILGLTLLGLATFLTLRFGFKVLARTKRSEDPIPMLFAALALALALYTIIVMGKKGSLAMVDTYMWLSMAVFCFDRTWTFPAESEGRAPKPARASLWRLAGRNPQIQSQ